MRLAAAAQNVFWVVFSSTVLFIKVQESSGLMSSSDALSDAYAFGQRALLFRRPTDTSVNGNRYRLILSFLIALSVSNMTSRRNIGTRVNIICDAVYNTNSADEISCHPYVEGHANF